MKLTSFLLLLLHLLLFCACSSNQNLSQSNKATLNQSYKQIAQQRYGENILYIFNSKHSFVLCQKKIPNDLPLPNHLLQFFVYDIKSKRIIFEDQIANAKVSWYSNTKLRITKQKGYITNPSDTGKWSYLYDLINRKKLPLETKQ